MKKAFSKLTVLLLIACMCITTIPAFADEADGTGAVETDYVAEGSENNQYTDNGIDDQKGETVEQNVVTTVVENGDGQEEEFNQTDDNGSSDNPAPTQESSDGDDQQVDETGKENDNDTDSVVTDNSGSGNPDAGEQNYAAGDTSDSANTVPSGENNEDNKEESVIPVSGAGSDDASDVSEITENVDQKDDADTNEAADDTAKDPVQDAAQTDESPDSDEDNDVQSENQQGENAAAIGSESDEPAVSDDVINQDEAAEEEASEEGQGTGEDNTGEEITSGEDAESEEAASGEDAESEEAASGEDAESEEDASSEDAESEDNAASAGDAAPEEAVSGEEAGSEEDAESEDAESKEDAESEEDAEAEEKTEEDEDKDKEEVTLPELVPFYQTARVNGVIITVSADAGVFPAHSTLSVRSVPYYTELYVDGIVENVRNEEAVVAVSYTFDIKVLDELGNEIQPADGQSVNVSFATDEVADRNLDTQVYHVSDGYAEELQTVEYAGTVYAETDGFSYYTVEFTYNKLEYVLEGNESVSLAEILKTLGLKGYVTAVECSNTELFCAEYTVGGWTVTALQAFDSEEWMKVTINDVVFEIIVTDSNTNIASDTWGNLDWTLDANGKLTISGSSVMKPLSVTSAWLKYKDEIKTVVISSDVKSIGENAFYECSALKSITIPGTVTSIGTAAFYGCILLEDVVLPSGLKSLGDNFLEGTSVLSITVPSSLEEIGEKGPFNGSAVESVTLQSGITTIYDYMFNGAQSLYDVTIPSTVTSVGKYAFQDCSSLTDLYIPEGVNYIHDGAFKNSGLVTVTLPSSLKYIGFEFLYGTSVEKIIIPGALKEIHTGNTVEYGQHTGPFYGSSVKSVILQSGLTTVYDYMFYGAASLTSVTIPLTVTSIGAYAFLDCSNLEDASISDSVTSIYDGAFKNTGLTDIALPAGLRYLGFEVLSGTAISSLVIPATLEEIHTGDTAEYGQHTGPFYGSAIEKVTLQKGFKGIFDYMFNGAAQLNSITIPDSVTSIGSYAFENCANLSQIALPKSVTAIYDGAFKNSGLTSVTLPESLEHLGFEFLCGTSVNSVTIPGTLQTVGLGYSPEYGQTTGIFYGSAVKKVVLGSGLPAIYSNMFSGAAIVTRVDIPTTVLLIEENAFADCPNLANVYYESLESYWKKVSIEDGNDALKNAAIHYRNKVIPTVTLSAKSFVYNGEVQQPTVVVKIGKKTLKASQYDVTYSKGCTAVGTYKVKVTLKGKYKGSKKVSFKIVPKTTRITKVVSDVKKITVQWKKQATQTTGYQVQYAANKTFTKNKKTITIAKKSTVKKAIKNLESGKTYYVRVRTYKLVNGKRIYSAWSAKIKKVIVG